MPELQSGKCQCRPAAFAQTSPIEVTAAYCFRQAKSLSFQFVAGIHLAGRSIGLRNYRTKLRPCICARSWTDRLVACLSRKVPEESVDWWFAWLWSSYQPQRQSITHSQKLSWVSANSEPEQASVYSRYSWQLKRIDMISCLCLGEWNRDLQRAFQQVLAGDRLACKCKLSTLV